MEKKTRIAYDPVLKRPGCAIIQAAFGCSGNLASLFDTEDWLLAPTENLGVFEVTDEQLGKLPEITRIFRKRNENTVP